MLQVRSGSLLTGLLRSLVVLVMGVYGAFTGFLGVEVFLFLNPQTPSLASGIFIAGGLAGGAFVMWEAMKRTSDWH